MGCTFEPQAGLEAVEQQRVGHVALYHLGGAAARGGSARGVLGGRDARGRGADGGGR